LGSDAGSTGTYSLTDGTLTQDLPGGYHYDFTIGQMGTGIFNQSNGSVSIQEELRLAVGNSSQGTYLLDAGDLTAKNIRIGEFGTAIFTQNGGTCASAELSVAHGTGGSGQYSLNGGNCHAETLTLAGGEGSHGTLSLGTNTQLLVDSYVFIGGAQNARGEVVQTGGSLASQCIETALAVGSVGNYTLGVGNVNVGGWMRLGYLGSSTFTQTGGRHAISGQLIIARDADSSGSYQLDDGALEARAVMIGYDGPGSFTQQGDTLRVGSDGLFLGFNPSGGKSSNGAYELNCGEIVCAGNTIVGKEGSGHFSHYGGAHRITGDLIVGANAEGSYNLNEWADLSELIAANLVVGQEASGLFLQEGGGARINSLVLGFAQNQQGAYDLYGGSLEVEEDAEIDRADNGALAQYRGAVTITNQLILGRDPGSSGAYCLAAGSLDAKTVLIGYDGQGEFTQSGGSLCVGDGGLFIGFNPSGGIASRGSFSLSGGSVNCEGNQYVGSDSEGVFSHSGGGNGIDGDLIIGERAIGRYELAGDGVLSAGAIHIGQQANGSFDQSGGEVWADNLVLGETSGINGEYSLGGGSLDATNATIGRSGTGAFTQNGGECRFSDILLLGKQTGGTGRFALNDGLLIAGTMQIAGDGGGSYEQSAGTGNITTLYVGFSPSGTGPIGSAVFRGGQLNVADVCVGGLTAGNFQQKGGVLVVSHGLIVGDGAAGTFSLDDGTLSTPILTVGSAAAGAFNQTGGQVTVNGDLRIGESAAGSGNYWLGGGRLTVEGNVTCGTGAGTLTLGGGIFNLSGNLSVAHLRVTGGFHRIQTGGSTVAAASLVLGPSEYSSGSYSIRAGSLTAGDLLVGLAGVGAFHIENASANVTVTRSLHFGP